MLGLLGNAPQVRRTAGWSPALRVGYVQSAEPRSALPVMGPKTQAWSLAKPKMYLDAEYKKSSAGAKEKPRPGVSSSTSTL